MKRIVIFALLLSAVSFQLSAYGDSAQASFAAIEKMFLEDRYEDVIDNSEQLILNRSYRRDELYYLKGLSQLKLNLFCNARESFNAIICARTNSARRFDAYIAIGDSYFLENNFDMAIKTYDDILGCLPENSNSPVIYYRLSGCYARCGDAGKAQYYFDTAALVAPLGFEAKNAPVVERVLAPAKAITTPPIIEIKKAVEKIPETHISIQVGSFKNKANAENFAGKLSGQGFDSHTESAMASGEYVYRVRVGKFISKDEAHGTVIRLKNRGYNIKICDDDTCE